MTKYDEGQLEMAYKWWRSMCSLAWSKDITTEELVNGGHELCVIEAAEQWEVDIDKLKELIKAKRLILEV